MKNLFTLFLCVLLSSLLHAQPENFKIGYQELPVSLTGHASDSFGNMYYSGHFKGELKVNNKIEGTGKGLEDIFFVKQGFAGNTVISRVFGSESSDEPVVDGLSFLDNNLYLACKVKDAINFQSFSIVPYQGLDVNVSLGCVVKLDTSGNVKWANKTSIEISKIYAVDNVIHVLGLSVGEVKYNEKLLYQSIPEHSIIHLMLDTSGNLLTHKSIISPVSGIYDDQAPLFISSYSDGKLCMLLRIFGESSFKIGSQNIPLPPEKTFYSVLIKTDTAYSAVSSKILNPVPINFFRVNYENVPPIQLSKQDSIYIILTSYESVTFDYDGLAVHTDYDHHTLVVFDSSLRATRVVNLGEKSGSPFNTGRNGLILKTINVINNELFISGTFTGLNESPSGEISPDEMDITIIPSLHTNFDLNGPSKSFVAKTSLDFTTTGLSWFGNHTEYETAYLFHNFSHSANDSQVVYSFADDNIWNPRIFNKNTAGVSGTMSRNADLPDNLKFVEYFSDGSRLVIGWASGRTSLDTLVIGIKSNRNRADAFIARVTSAGTVKWYKRIRSTLAVALPMKLKIKNDKAYFLINYGGSVNQNNYIEINGDSYPAYDGSWLASVDTAGNITTLNLRNDTIKYAYIMDFNLFGNGDIVILTRVDYRNYAVPFPNPGFYLYRLDRATNVATETRKIITRDAYSFYPSKLEIDAFDNVYISSPLYAVVSPQEQYTTLKLHNGNNVIDTITIENNITTPGGLGILKMDMNRFHWYKRANSASRFNVRFDIPSVFSSNNKIIFAGRPSPGDNGDTSNTSFYWDNKFVLSDMNSSKTYLFRLDSAGNMERNKSINDFELQYAKVDLNGRLLMSGNISKATGIDTISIGYQGGIDALSLVIDSTFNSTQSYRMASPFAEYMTDIAIWKDSLYSLAFSAQTVPSLYLNRPYVLSSDYDPDAYLSSSIIQKPIVLPLQLISFSGIREEDLVYLNWAVMSNSIGDVYVLQRSENESRFSDIGRRQSINGTSGNTYRFTDDLKNYGKYYYRLKITTLDGKITYSKSIRIVYAPKENTFYYENNTRQLYIQRLNKAVYGWHLFDINGRKVLGGKKVSGSTIVQLAAKLKGEYIIQTFDSVNTATYKFVIY